MVVLVAFLGTSCPHCKQMLPVLQMLTQHQVPVVTVWIEHDPGRAQGWQVRGVPTLFICEGDAIGNVTGTLQRIDGATDFNTLASALNQARQQLATAG